MAQNIKGLRRKPAFNPNGSLARRSPVPSTATGRGPSRSEDDLESFFDVPAAVLCAFCGQADCPGCTTATEQASGVIAIVPWERSGSVWVRLWATANATTQGAEAFFAVLPDGEIRKAMSFAVVAELLAVSSM